MGDRVKSSSLADAESSGKEKPLSHAESSGKEKPLAHAESNGKEKHVRPDDIEKTSMEIIDDELRMRGIVIPKESKLGDAGGYTENGKEYYAKKGQKSNMTSM